MLPLLVALAACPAHDPRPPAPAGAEEVAFVKLAEGVWMHTSYRDMRDWGWVPTNGLVVVDGEASILVDTAWNDAQTADVLDWAANTLGRPVSRAVFTHAHSDKMGGVGAVRSRGIATFANAASNTVAPERDLMPAEHDLVFDGEGVSADLAPLVTFYPGGAHTRDNIVVGVPAAGVLFGGCLVRPGDATDLGNTADADVPHWDEAVAAIVARFPDAAIVVPSHGPPAGRELLDLTIRLASAAD